MVRKGRAVWRGTGKDGTGDLATDSGVLSSTPYSFKTRYRPASRASRAPTRRS